MANLIDDLKKEHAAITATLDKVRDSNVSSAEAHRILMAAQRSFLAHLKKEDLQLYPVLNNAALKDPALQRTIDFYAKDMAEISQDAEKFFQKYSRDDSKIDIEFAKAFGRFYATIIRRMRSEETSLYKAFETLKG